VTTDNQGNLARRVSRIAVAAGGLALGSLAAPAFASPPTTWQDPPHEGFLHYVLVLGGSALAIIAVITLLVYLPSMMKRQSSDGSSAFQEDPEWFGGPRRGVEAAEETAPADRSKLGGASARW
jgi:hypothetical protein